MEFDSTALREKAHKVRLLITPDRIMAFLALVAIVLLLCPWVTVPLAGRFGYDISFSILSLADLADQLAHYVQSAQIAVEKLQDLVALVRTLIEQLHDVVSLLENLLAEWGW